MALMAQQQRQAALQQAMAQQDGIRMPEMASATQSFAVTVPPGATPGASFQATAPNGQLVMVTVPPGATSGTTLDLEYEGMPQPRQPQYDPTH